MAKKTYIDNWRVELYPHRIGHLGTVSVPDSWFTPEEREKHFRESCETLVREVRRHVDTPHDAHIMYDKHEVCEFCGSDWSDYPECCNRAQDENEVSAISGE